MLNICMWAKDCDSSEVEAASIKLEWPPDILGIRNLDGSSSAVGEQVDTNKAWRTISVSETDVSCRCCDVFRFPKDVDVVVAGLSPNCRPASGPSGGL